MTLLLWMEILQGPGWELGYAGARLMCIRDRGKIRGISASLVTNSAKLLTAGDVHVYVCGWHMRATENMKTKLSNGFVVGLTIKRTLTSDARLLADVWLTHAHAHALTHTDTPAHNTLGLLISTFQFLHSYLLRLLCVKAVEDSLCGKCVFEGLLTGPRLLQWIILKWNFLLLNLIKQLPPREGILAAPDAVKYFKSSALMNNAMCWSDTSMKKKVENPLCSIHKAIPERQHWKVKQQ